MNLNFNSATTSTYDLEAVLDFLPYPFLVSDLRNGVRENLFVNRRFEEEIGYHRSDIPTIDDWFRVAYPDPAYRKWIAEQWQDAAKNAVRDSLDHVIMKARIQTKFHGKVWYEVKASITERNHFVAFVNIDDILRKEEELKVQHQNKDRTLSILSHDLRAPLTNLLSLSQLVQNSALTSDEFTDITRTINRKTAHALELLDTTLHWTRTNFETIQVKKEETLLADVLRSILVHYDSALKEKNIVVDYLKINGISLHTDRDILTIILRNVISNAIKFTPTDGRISIEHTRIKNGQAISVTDSGFGMTQDQIEKIKAGKIESRDGTDNEKGHGIGLSFCMELAERIAAQMEIVSSSQGTCVQIVIPDNRAPSYDL